MTAFPQSPSIAIVGSGAVGGYYGARLAHHGFDVHFLLRSDYSAVQANGFVIQSRDGDFTLPPERVRAYRSAADMPHADLVIVTLKTTANHFYSELITPLVRDGTAILTLQNGLGNEEQLAHLFGPQRILGGLAFTCINRIGPGVIHHMDHGLIRIGEYVDGQSPRAAAIAKMFNDSLIHCQVLDDLRYGRWEKLVWNVPFNGLGAAMDLTTDRLLANETGVSFVREVMQEVIATANAIGVKLPAQLVEQQIERTRTMGPYQSSMQIDRRMGRPLERDAIISRPLEAARNAGVTAAVLEWIDRMLRAVDDMA